MQRRVAEAFKTLENWLNCCFTIQIKNRIIIDLKFTQAICFHTFLIPKINIVILGLSAQYNRIDRPKHIVTFQCKIGIRIPLGYSIGEPSDTKRAIRCYQRKPCSCLCDRLNHIRTGRIFSPVHLLVNDKVCIR